MCWPCYHGDLTTFVTLKTLTSSLTQLINPLIVLHNTHVWKREYKRLIAKVNLGDKHYSKLASSLIKQPPKPWSGFRVLVAITCFTCKSWVILNTPQYHISPKDNLLVVSRKTERKTPHFTFRAKQIWTWLWIYICGSGRKEWEKHVTLCYSGCLVGLTASSSVWVISF